MGGPRVLSRILGESDAIVLAYKDGASIDELAERYGCSNTPIRKILIARNIEFRPARRRKVLQHSAEQVEQMYRSGSSTKEIARKLGVDKNTVSYFLSSVGCLRSVPIAAREFHVAKDTDRGMLAGLLVGEGTIVIRGRGVVIRIVNQDAAVLGWLSQFGGRIHWGKKRPSCPNPCGVWDLGRVVDVFHFLTSIRPLLIGKKRQLATAALNVLKQNYGFQEIP